MTCRRNRGPLSSLEAGPLGLRRTQLGRRETQVGPRCFLEPSFLHPLSSLFFSFFLFYFSVFLWVHLNPGTGAMPGSMLLLR